MADGPRRVLYVGAVLPKASETFVYREVLGLRARGADVLAASVRPPERDLGDERLDALADEAVVVYGPGLLARAARGALRRPDVLARGLLDAAAGRDVPPGKRPRLLWQCLGGLSLAERLRGRGVEHVHAHMAHVPASVAMYAARALGVPFSFTGHAADLFRDRSLLPAKLARAAFVACISEWHRGFYREAAPAGVDVPDARLPVIRCGVAVDQFAPRAGPAPADAPVLAVGRLVPKKGFDLLVEAVARLAPGQRPRVAIVGDGPEQARLERLVAERGVAERVELLGARPNAEVRRLMGEALAVALPCRVSPDGDKDGIPVVLMEAMACGLPVVSGDLPSIRELIAADATGLLVPPGDLDALTAALERLTGDPDLRARLGAAARARVEEEFALEVNLDRLEAAFARSRPAAARGAAAGV